MKDGRIRYNQAERQAVIAYRVKCFCLPNQSLTAEEMADRFLGNLQRIEKACQQPGPFIYIVYKDQIRSIDL